MEDNYNPSIPKWLDANYPRTFMYDDAHVNVMEEALPIQMNHKSKGIKRERWNPEYRSYNFEDSTTLVQTLSRIYVFCRVKTHVII